MEGLAEELVLVAGAAAVLCEEAPERPSNTAAVQELIVRAAWTGTGNPAAEIERRMGLQQYLWRQLGFLTLSDHIALRRAHFHVLTTGDPAERAREHALQVLAGERHRNGYVGLLAGVVIAAADGTWETEEAAADVCRGVTMAVTAGHQPVGRGGRPRMPGRMGTRLAVELATQAISAANLYDVEYEPLLVFLVQPDAATGSPRAAAFLVEVPDDELNDVFRWLINATRPQRYRELSDQVMELLEARVAHVDPEHTRHALCEISTARFERSMDDDPEFDAVGFAAEWPFRDLADDFAFLVSLLVRERGHDAAALTLATEALREADLDDCGWNYLWLSRNLARKLAEDPPLPADEADAMLAFSVEVLARLQRRFEPELPVHDNIAILEWLRWADRQSDNDYVSRLRRWELVRQRRELDERLRPLADEERWFELLWHYFRTLSYWGLATSPSTTPGDIVDAGQSARRRAILPWARGERPPESLAAQSERRALSAGLPLAGHSLFFEPGFAEPEYDAARAAVDVEAGAALGVLLSKQGFAIDQLPREISQILDSHRRALELPELLRL